MLTGPSQADIEAGLLALIARRGTHSSACPSEVARTLSDKDWRALMTRVRQAAWRLMQSGQLDITQAGVSIVHMDTVKGPIRVRLPRVGPGPA